MTGQNYAPGNPRANTSSQTVNTDPLWDQAQQARKELFNLVDSFDSEMGIDTTVETLLNTAYDSLLHAGKLDPEREWIALNPVNIREVHLESLQYTFCIVNFLCRLNRAYNRVLWLEREGGERK